MEVQGRVEAGSYRMSKGRTVGARAHVSRIFPEFCGGRKSLKCEMWYYVDAAWSLHVVNSYQ